MDQFIGWTHMFSWRHRAAARLEDGKGSQERAVGRGKAGWLETKVVLRKAAFPRKN